jgi:hypothetical protein
MTRRPKFAGYLLALFLSASLTSPSFAQRSDTGSRAAQQQAPPPAQRPAPAPAQRPDTGNRPPQRTAPPPAQRPDRGNRPPQPSSPVPTSRQGSMPRGSSDATRRNQAPVTRDDRPPTRSGNTNPSARNSFQQTEGPNRAPVNRQTLDPNRPPSSQYSRDEQYSRDGQYSRGGQNNYSNSYRNDQQHLSPEDRQRVLQNEQRFRQLSPQQQQDMRDRQRVWQQMTPQQRDHIKNEVLPSWRTLPPQRKKAIEQRLGVLQNMPEYARNQHLNDPNFTRGMSPEDRATLRDLSHVHVGGAPDPPN